MNHQSFGKETLESMNLAGWYNQWIVQKITKFLKGDILEVGCGIGNFTAVLNRYGDVYAFDIEESYIELTRKKAKNAKVGVGNIEKGHYFFKEHLFDTLVCFNVLEHIKDDESALKNLHKLLKPGGYLILIVPAHQFLYGEIDKSINHYRRYNKEELIKRLININFKMLVCRRFNMLGSIGWWFAGKVLRENKIRKNRIKLFNFLGPVILPLENLIEAPIGTSILLVAEK